MSESENSYLTPFDAARSAFGRHETFPLRYSWLTKGFQEFRADRKLFSMEDASVRLGVGKNMVSSIRYWLQATGMIRRAGDGYETTELGYLIFDEKIGLDPYLEDEATIWLVHWLLATNAELATGLYWFFNRFHKPGFSGQEVSAALMDFARTELKAKPSATTIKNDANVLLRMYSRSRGSARVSLEDALDSPLSLLNLVSSAEVGKAFQSQQSSRDVPVGVFGFAVADLFNGMSATQLPVEQLMYGTEIFPSLGGVFRMTESALLAHLEKLVYQYPDFFELRETAGIHQFYLLKAVDPQDMLLAHYSDAIEDVA